MLLLLEHRSLSGANKGTLSGKPKSTTTNAFQYIEKIALDPPPPKINCEKLPKKLPQIAKFGPTYFY